MSTLLFKSRQYKQEQVCPVPEGMLEDGLFNQAVIVGGRGASYLFKEFSCGLRRTISRNAAVAEERVSAFEIGKRMGAVAFSRGIQSAPALDIHVKHALKFHKQVKETLALLDGWNKGWHAANLAN